jgi:RNA polymerase sigma factor (sigma-70 family)
MEASALRRQRAAVLPRSRRLLTTLSDDRLVEQVRRGNAVAFEVIFDRHYRGILSFCRHMLGSREEAEDAVQQTFTSAYTDLQSNRREIRLKAWLYTIARNRCLSVLRARREQAADLEDEALPTAGLSEQVQQRADLQELLHDLRELPHDQREALVLFEIGDLSQAEVAKVIGVEPVKVKALVYQARSALIENREARAIPCSEIREQLANASGGALRRAPLRRHLNACEGCREYRDQVKAQRRALAALLPVVPTAGLKSGVLAAIGFGGGAGGGGIAAGGGVATGTAGASSGTAAGGTGLLASFGGISAAKLAVAATLGTGALIGGGVAVENAINHDSGGTDSAEAAETSDQNGGGSAPGSTPGAGSPTPVVNGGGSEGKSDEGKKDDDKDGKGDDARGGKSEDAKDDKGDSKSNNGRGGGSRHGSSGRGNGTRGNSGNTAGGTRGNSGSAPGRTRGNSGSAPGRTRGNSGSTPAAGNGSSNVPAQPTPGEGNKGSRNNAATPVLPPPAADGSEKGVKADAAEKVLAPIVPLPLPQ